MTPAVEKLVKAARAVDAKMKLCKDAIDGAFVFSSMHGQKYEGPTYGKELEALASAISAVGAEEREGKDGVR